MLLSWGLTVFLIAVMADLLVFPWISDSDSAGFLRDPPGENLIFSLLADATGLDRLEPVGRQVFAGMGVLAAFCLLLPPLRRFGAFVTLVFFLILVAALLSPLLPTEVPLDHTGIETDKGALLYLALASLTASVLLYSVHPRKR